MKVKVKGNSGLDQGLIGPSGRAPHRTRFGRFLTLLLMLLVTRPVFAVEVCGTAWDGSQFAAEWLSIDHQILEVRMKEAKAAFPLEDLAVIEFPVPLRAPSGPVAFHLHDGGMLFGELLGGQAESVTARTAAGTMDFSWTNLAAIRLAEPTQFKRANELFEEARQDRSPSQDKIVSRDQAEVKVLEGRLETLTESGGAFVFSGESRKFQNSKLFGMVLAAGAARPNPKPVRIELADGSTIFADILSADDARLRLQVSFATSPLELPLAEVRRIRVRSSRVEFLSDGKPSAQKTEGILHSPSPVGVDRSVLGSPISIGGRTFERGIGAHSRTEISYPIGGGFEQFAATIGIDDAVRPLGSVVMQVKGDGKTLFDSGPMTGETPPRDILVDVKGVQTLTLLVDYGDGLDASDHASWGDARLLRPRAAKGKSKSP